MRGDRWTGVTRLLTACVTAGTFSGTSLAQGEFTILDSWSGGGAIGLGVDPVSDIVWTMGGTDIERHDYAGAVQTSFPTGSEWANDADLDVLDQAMTLGGVALPAGTLLYSNGESGVAEIYAFTPPAYGLATTFVSQYGVSHCVGFTVAHARGTLFLLQDNVPGGADDNQVAEIDPADGSVLGLFDLDGIISDFDVSYGDIEYDSRSGTLFIVSSLESSVLEITPDGTVVGLHPLPAGVGALSGIAIDESSDEVWVQSNGGSVWRLRYSPPCTPDVNGDGVLDNGDIGAFVGLFLAGDLAADFNGDSVLDNGDIGAFAAAFLAGC